VRKRITKKETKHDKTIMSTAAIAITIIAPDTEVNKHIWYGMVCSWSLLGNVY